jgi:hypothetical protein
MTAVRMSEYFLNLEGARILDTYGYLATQRAIDDLARVNGMGVIHGDAGNGKTFSVKSGLRRLKGTEVIWFDFPGRTTTKTLVRALLKELTGIEHDATRPKLEALLLDRLAERRRVAVIDEAQRLYDESIEYLRHLYDRPSSQFALLLVGGNHCWSRVSSYPMVWSRVYRKIAFEPLDIDEVIAHIPRFHPVYADVAAELIAEIDDSFAHGNLRDWTKFTVDAVTLMKENNLDHLTEDLVADICSFAAHGDGDE